MKFSLVITTTVALLSSSLDIGALQLFEPLFRGKPGPAPPVLGNHGRPRLPGQPSAQALRGARGPSYRTATIVHGKPPEHNVKDRILNTGILDASKLQANNYPDPELEGHLHYLIQNRNQISKAKALEWIIFLEEDTDLGQARRTVRNLLNGARKMRVGNLQPLRLALTVIDDVFSEAREQVDVAKANWRINPKNVEPILELARIPEGLTTAEKELVSASEKYRDLLKKESVQTSELNAALDTINIASVRLQFLDELMTAGRYIKDYNPLSEDKLLEVVHNAINNYISKFEHDTQ